MKPICARCNLFMHMIHAGEYFEERMPGPDGAKRQPADDIGGCSQHAVPEVDCAICLAVVLAAAVTALIVPDLPRVQSGDLAGWQPYKLWVGDVHECRGCGAQVIVGVPPQPISEHYKPDYAELVRRTGATRHIDDC